MLLRRCIRRIQKNEVGSFTFCRQPLNSPDRVCCQDFEPVSNLQRCKILPNQGHGGPVLFDENDPPRPSAQGLDPHGSGSRVEIHKDGPNYGCAEDVEQRLTEPIARRPQRRSPRPC